MTIKFRDIESVQTFAALLSTLDKVFESDEQINWVLNTPSIIKGLKEKGVEFVSE